MARLSVTLKLATSLDGRIATATGESQWITGPHARAQVHALRAAHAAVLVGVGTVLADNPKLTARTDPPAERQPLRVVLDTQARTPSDAVLVRSACAKAPVRLYVGPQADPARRSALQRPHVMLASAPLADGRIDVKEVCADLAALGLDSLFVEGGGQVAAAFLRAELVDRIEWFRAALVLGQEGVPAIGPLVLASLAQAPRFNRVDVRVAGPDLWESYERSEG